MIDKEQLEQAIAAQEGLRGTLDDAIIEATIAALKRQLEDLEAAGSAQRRKLVTILFMDTVGSTEMAHSLDKVKWLENNYRWLARPLKPLVPGACFGRFFSALVRLRTTRPKPCTCANKQGISSAPSRKTSTTLNCERRS